MRDKISKDFQDYADSGIWFGENDYTKNFPIGNVIEWFLERFESEIQHAIAQDRKENIEIIKHYRNLAILGNNDEIDPVYEHAFEDIINAISKKSA